mmetsp:Transcript_15825/g.52176  ORF Transcript_15825/g.52176 Transcript_15825/m.52176 type:complete len:348 (-) Transcript_15825:169-1212(-)|eukprot:CAMPEP_0202750370 /NCGR_PEP_ID=MMETSP1388-20130828/11262_1 /ASSEMBLY_ACC=CAM_ASM_000864 /TAXON_ID=37098 /ORGANISM="Isochrysis sp, Strain CCMP1244" /LENGTH=347 /DNA_ID=CAMNT_0049417943 /DNA_START=23 /DNA_END=1066 /DNA_ORIENTATION=-
MDDCSSASSAMPTTASHVSGVTIHIPAVPVIELTLLVIAALLWRLLVAVHAGLAMLHALQAEKSPHSGVPSAEKGSPPPPPHLSRQLSRERLRGGTPVPPPSPRGEGEPNMLADARPLRISAGHFGKCLSGDADVDVALFIAACQNYCKVLALIGPFTLLSTREVISNMKKIEHSFELAPVRYRSMRELLEAEVAAGMHQPGGVLVDPSAAVGLLWARRGLTFWVHIFRELSRIGRQRQSGRISPAEGPTPSGRSTPRGGSPTGDVSLKELVERGYAATLQPFNGWLSQNSMSLALRAVPQEFPRLAPTQLEMLEDLEAWCDVVEQLVGRMAAVQLELDLEDRRKSI